MKKLKILFIGESTEDDVFAIQRIIDELSVLTVEKDIIFSFSYINSGLGDFNAKNINIKNIQISRIFSSIILFPFLFIGAFIYIFINTPSLIFTKGRYISLPIVLSAMILKIPIFLHETSSSVSAVNSFIANKSLIVFTSFNNTKGLNQKKELRLGLPLPVEVFNSYLLSKKNIEKILKRDINKPILFFSATLDNSKKINDFVLNIIGDLVDTFYVFHQVKEEEYFQVKKESEIMLNNLERNYYHIFKDSKNYNNIEVLKDIQVISNIIISEFSENLIFKISSLKKASILIIFQNSRTTSAYDKTSQKIESAYSYQEIGATYIIEESNLKKHLFINKIDQLFKDNNSQDLVKMSEKAKEFATPEAGKLIATYLYEYWKLKIN